MIQIIITGLAGAVVTLAGIIYKGQIDKISKLEEQIAKQDERDAQRSALLEATTKTLQAVVDVGMERLRTQQPPEQKP
jgi:parvulin-like peptidyl-prolyl isomerase